MSQTPIDRSDKPSARAYALLSVGAACLTIGLKVTAYRLTGSVGLLSDAVESLVNLAAVHSLQGKFQDAVRDLDQAMLVIAGTARSMGVEVER